jgi:hypothetical protein
MSWVQSRIYAAGGDHIPSTWATFRDQTGIQAVLHLRPEAPTVFRGGPPRAFLWLDIEAETDADLEARWLAARYLSSCLAQGYRAMIHSSLTLHRTRWALASYLLYEGWTIASTMREVEKPPWLSPYHTEAPMWAAFEKMVESRKAEGGEWGVEVTWPTPE